MSEPERLEAFEKMLADVQKNYRQFCERLDALKAEGKTKSATFREYLGNKMTCQYILTMYKDYGLIEEFQGEGRR